MPAVANALTECDIAAIRAMFDIHRRALLNQDSAAFVATCADDIILLPPYQPPLEGRAACKAFMDKFAKPGTFTVDTVELEGCGDLAFSLSYAKGSWREDETTLKILAIYRRQPDLSWKMIRYTYNTNEPPNYLCSALALCR